MENKEISAENLVETTEDMEISQNEESLFSFASEDTRSDFAKHTDEKVDEVFRWD